jgi:SM-20-related protein
MAWQEGKDGAGLPVCQDDWLPPALQRQVYDFLMQPGWQFGWKSDPKADRHAFWHKHFAGTQMPGGDEPDCAGDLAGRAPLLHRLWLKLAETMPGQRLVRCYANGHAFGDEGSVHIDTRTATGRTSIYYPHDIWDASWGGETVFFTPDRSDIVAAVYPKPNRLISFAGAIPHAARGVSRTCPQLRVTLMFKTELVTAV